MNCTELEPWISAYQDGELDARRVRVVEEHLAQCAACRALTEEWEAMARVLRADLARCEAPESLHARVMREIPEPEPTPLSARRGSVWTPRGWSSFGLVPIGAAAAWLLLLHRPAPPVQIGGIPVPQVRLSQGAVTGPGAFIGPSATTPLAILPTATGSARPGSAGRPPGGRAPGTTPAPSIQNPRSKIQNRDDRPELELIHQLRQLRPRHGRYRLVEAPRRRPVRMARGLRRWRPEAPTVMASQPAPGPDSRWSGPLPRISVVDYVLPQAQPQAPPSQAETEFVLRAAQPVQMTEAVSDF